RASAAQPRLSSETAAGLNRQVFIATNRQWPDLTAEGPTRLMTVTEISRAFIDQSRQLLTDSYMPRIEQAIDGLSIENMWWRSNAAANSIGNLILHLDGNVRQWIISGLGGATDIRERQRE